MRLTIILLVIVALFTFSASAQPAAEESLDRVLRFAHTDAAQDIQEIATLVRSIAGIPQTSADISQKTLTLRASADRITLAEWLFKELDRTASTPADQTSAHEYRAGGDGGELVRLLYLKHTAKPEDIQELATVVRSTTDIRYFFPYNRLKVLAVRAPEAQLALADWLISQLDLPAQPERGSSDPRNYQSPRDGNEVVRVFYLSAATSVSDFQAIATETWKATDIRRAFTYNRLRALTLRASADKLAQAERLINEREKR